LFDVAEGAGIEEAVDTAQDDEDDDISGGTAPVAQVRTASAAA
jgi:hypothetical protein